MTTKRDISIDLLRVFACFMVVFLHVAGQNWSNVDVHSMEWTAFNVYDCAVRSCVPLFFMISGKLFLSREKMVPLDRLFKKNIRKLIIIYFVWSFLYAVSRIGISHLTLSLIIQETIASEFHLWYLPALVGVYLMIPILWSVVHYEDGRYVKYVCFMVLTLGVLRETCLLMPFLPETLYKLLSTFSFELGIYSGYFLMGYYIYHTKDKWDYIKTKYLIVMLAFFMILGIILTHIYSLYVGEQNSFLYENQTFFPAIEAILLMMIFFKIPTSHFSDKIKQCIIKISHTTLFVYLFHPFVIDYLDINFGINSLFINCWISVPLLAVCITIFSMFIGMIMSYVPVIKSWI